MHRSLPGPSASPSRDFPLVRLLLILRFANRGRVSSNANAGWRNWSQMAHALRTRLRIRDLCHFQRTAPRERDARAAVTIVVDDTRVRLALHANIAMAHRPQTYAYRLGGVDLDVF